MAEAVKIKIFQKGFNYSQDGPGNRLVYHMQGCNFRCKWCSNPESMGNTCKTTVSFSPQDIAEEAASCRMMFFDGGGVTFTGGEPTVQFDELQETLDLLKRAGIHTAVETNGSHKDLCQLSDKIDYLIVDLKHVDRSVHEKWTGADNGQTLENIRRLVRSRNQLLVRIPLIHGFNSCYAGNFAAFFDGQDTKHINFELLPYHEYGKDKWEKPYEIKNGFITEEELESFKSAFHKKGLNLIRT